MKNNYHVFESYELKDYPKVESIKFPKNIYIAYAVCRELMFRTEVKKNILCEDSGS